MSGANTEDDILSNIPDFAGADDSGDTTQSDTTQDVAQGTTSAAPEPAATTDADSGATKPAPQQIVRRHDGLIERQNPDNPATRDLVDPVTGRIVAKGGIERKVYEDGARHARENNQLKQQLQQANQQLSSVNQVTQVARDLQIRPEDQVVAMRVMSDFLKDPVKTLEYLVSEVKAKGYQIPFLTEGVSHGMDLQAVGRMIDSKMQPLTQQQQQAQQQEKFRADAKVQLDSFLSTHAEAEANLQTIGEMLTAQPGLTLHDAYIKMVTWAVQHGLDYTQELGPQIAARQAQPQTTQQQTQQQRPLPQGRSAASGAQAVGGAAQFTENSSWADIIRDSMRESGMQLN